MFKRLVLSSCILLLVFVANANADQYQMEMSVTEADLASYEPISVGAQLNFESPRKAVCFYLPLNDPEYFDDKTQQLIGRKKAHEKRKPLDASIRVVSIDGLKFEGEQSLFIAYEFSQVKSSMSLEFEFSLPKWRESVSDQLLFQNFYPQLLEDCDGASSSKDLEWKVKRSIDYRVGLRWPSSWQLSSAHRMSDPHTLESQASFSFNLTKNYKMRFRQYAGVEVSLVYKSKEFESVFSRIESSLLSLEALLGTYPYKRLVLVETQELERPRTAGVVAINSPRQETMRQLQINYSNWLHWQLVFSLAQQWYGSSVQPKSWEEYWLIRATSEYVSMAVIDRQPEMKNLFKLFMAGSSRSLLELNIHQTADIIASWLGSTGVDTRLRAESSVEHPYRYLRHVLALRYIHWLFGEAFSEALRDFTEQYRQQRIDSDQFLDFLSQREELENQPMDAKTILLRWWEKKLWPDYALDSLEFSDETINFKVLDLNQYVLPVDVYIQFSSGRIEQKLVYFESDQALVSVAKRKDESLLGVEINPGRELFDDDRFNNSSAWPSINFFPGNARGLKDDAYTLVWLPFPMLLPGEDLSWNFGFNLRRFVRGGISGIASYTPSKERTTGYSLAYRSRNQGLAWLARAIENYRQGYRGDRLLKIQLSKPILINDLLNWGLTYELATRQTLAVARSRHLLYGLGSDFNISLGECQLQAKAAFISSFARISGFDYQKLSKQAELNCRLSDSSWSGLRFFSGDFKALRGEILSGSVGFQPQNIDEARLRFPGESLPVSNSIRSLNFDHSFSFALPLPDSWPTLSKKTKWRSFWDYALSGPRIYSTAGLGLSMPLGGDIAGRSGLTLSEASVLMSVYRRVGEEIDNEPAFILSFLGEI